MGFKCRQVHGTGLRAQQSHNSRKQCHRRRHQGLACTSACTGPTQRGFAASMLWRIGRSYAGDIVSWAAWESPAYELRCPELPVRIPPSAGRALAGETLPSRNASVVHLPIPLSGIGKGPATAALERRRVPGTHACGGSIDRTPRRGELPGYDLSSVPCGLLNGQGQRRQWLDRDACHRRDQNVTFHRSVLPS